MMDLIQVVDNLSPELYQRLKHAVETGKWPEGTPVDKSQLDSAMQIVMAYQAKVLESDEIMTVGKDGQIVQKSKQVLKQQFSESSNASNNNNDIARFSNL